MFKGKSCTLLLNHPTITIVHVTIISNGSSYYLLAFLGCLILYKLKHQCRFSEWHLFRPSTILVAPFEEKPYIQPYKVQKTGSLESKCWLLPMEWYNMQQRACHSSQLERGFISGGLDGSSSLFSLKDLQKFEFGL